MSSREPMEGRCGARTGDGGHCMRYPLKGAKRCRRHGSATKKARQAAARNVKRDEALAEVSRLVRRAGVDQHPVEHLLDSLYRAAAEVEVFGQLVADLDAAGEVTASETPGRLRGWAERRHSVEPVDGADVEDNEDGTVRIRSAVRVDIDHDPLFMRAGEDKVSVHPFLKEYNDALERRARFAKLALDAGIEERRVQLAETQAAVFAGAIRSILTELGIKQDRNVVAVVKAELMKMSSEVGGRT